MGLLDALLLDPYRMNVWIAVRTDGVPGTGTQNDPYDGSTQPKFDAVMNSLPSAPPVAVRLGPGMFQTKGYADDLPEQGWQPKPGMKIVGSGIDVTTLQLAGGSTGAYFYAVSHALKSGSQPNLMDFFEISDLTIDCNLAAYSGVQAACGAVRAMGNHVRIRRLKAINWGTKGALRPCFVVVAVTASDVASVEDCGIEECVAINPATGAQGNVGPMTVFHAGGSEAPPTTPLAYGVGPWIRNCFVDGSPSALEIRALSMAWCKAGVIEGNQAHNVMYGTFQQTTAAQDIVVRNNWFKNVNRGVLLGGYNESQVFGVTNVLVEGNVVELATATGPFGGLIGIHLSDSGAAPPTFATAVVRDNKIRYVDGQNDPSYVGYPMLLNGATDLLVRNNVVEWSLNTNITHPVRNARCASVVYFNNQKPTGELVQGWSDDTGNYYEELSTIADFALVMGLFNRKT